MLKKNKNKSKNQNDKYFLITVSDKSGTRHFKIPKLVKKLIIGATATLSFALITSNLIVFNQKDELIQTKSLASSLEDAFVRLTSKNSTLNQTLKLSGTERELMSVVLAQMEQISGVNAELESTILDRLTAISNHFVSKELDFVELDDRVILLEESIGLDGDESGESIALEDRITLASLSISQQRILHDSIPNGYPTRNIGITSKFGKRKHPTTKQASFHNGIDLKAAKGTNLYATADGVVKQSAPNKLSGKLIVIAHNFGFESRYAHLSELKVKVGDVVQKGDLIGFTGNTGRSDGPHLHYEVRHLSKALDPIDFLTWEFGNQEIFTKVRGIQWQSLISLINKQISRPTLQLSQVALKSRAL